MSLGFEPLSCDKGGGALNSVRGYVLRHAALGAPQQIHSRKGVGACQANFGALHHGAFAALQQIAKV
jgi:hypothetical protein